MIQMTEFRVTVTSIYIPTFHYGAYIYRPVLTIGAISGPHCRFRVPHWHHITPVHINQCNTFTPQIKGSFCGINMLYHNHSSPGVLQLPWCAITFQWNAVQLPIGMYIIMLQLPLVCYNDTRKPIHSS